MTTESPKKQYDYIIVGAGAAGLMLADGMVKDPYFKDKTILLLDKDSKKTNDRTWCFWEKGPGPFDAIVHKTWQHIHFAGQHFSKRHPIAPYTYKMVRGIDFYQSVMQRIAQHKGLDFVQGEVAQVTDRDNGVRVTTSTTEYLGKQAFSSLFHYGMATHQSKYPVLQQHFVGWFVKTDVPIFDPDQATYMDFSIPQKGNTRFMYILPTSAHEALVEYTLFSAHLLPKEAYEEALRSYLTNDLKLEHYEVVDTEMGSIPMTAYNFGEHHGKNLRYIGTAGGWAKPSTGYTFMSTAKKIPKLLAHIKTGKALDELSYKNRFWFYDLLFLDVLHQDNARGHMVFEHLFENRTLQQVFKFLDEESHFGEDLGTMWASPKWRFVKALIRRLLRGV
ncbi:lycopene cyclase family protein [Maribacter sp. 2307ULW6-5]|uniref:lycopene cyclase family protein n=1 Tax=Maribacter sp. 2307ULW6-5 TaxID=3386275 RepID=UPI0039BCD2A9